MQKLQDASSNNDKGALQMDGDLGIELPCGSSSTLSPVKKENPSLETLKTKHAALKTP